ncbi:unnamed protein product [Blepharisma stoltei]|uniref:Uncharacterized protein n=1 Tax=Blepharisma stoltei TaxID=1481888 RepID=A0AAU9IHJ7_9CILI|nr:unnamed protein product [Blepharisma stoltei]
MRNFSSNKCAPTHHLVAYFALEEKRGNVIKIIISWNNCEGCLSMWKSYSTCRTKSSHAEPLWRLHMWNFVLRHE